MAFQLHGISLRKALVHIRLLNRKLIMEKGFLDKDFTRTSVTQNSLQELQEIWD
ncbi:hypothetical protein Goklo_029238 [Gossypium klotzschianum]|uniref:Uncharacterized protein n=1 Tax=Gossypium klotzschianum TaxID=34286 RepID=A0A7J8WD79_9ROSI|nr:hypothetical protein [Gossypium klotzschianum]